MALRRAKTIGAESCQIFVKTNMRWLGKPFSEPDVKLYAAELADQKVRHVFGHTGYLINLAAPESPNRNKSLESLIQEIEFAGSIDLPFLVMHPGAHLGAGVDQGIRRIVKALDEVFTATRKSRVRIALENTAGQGSCLGSKMEHLAAIIDKTQQPDRLGICLDTAHFFAAGYDIRTEGGWDAAIGEVEAMMGLDRILGFHLNDSKTPLGSRVDRHAHIGEGHIGKSGFRHIVNDRRFAKHPACLETPKSDDLGEDIKNLAVLRALVSTGKNPRKTRIDAATKRKP
jgi:deoxyribonuclease-4